MSSADFESDSGSRPDAVEVQGVRVRTHPALCNGCGNCHRFASRVYVLGDDGYIGFHLMDVPAELAADARLGAQVCPEGAITVIEPSLISDTASSETASSDTTSSDHKTRSTTS